MCFWLVVVVPGKISLSEIFKLLTIQEEGSYGYGSRKAVEGMGSLNHSVFACDTESVTPPSLPQHLATTNLLSVSIGCLFWTFYVNGIMQYVVLCDWLLLLSKMISGFICVMACVSTSFFLDRMRYYVPYFVYPFIR